MVIIQFYFQFMQMMMNNISTSDGLSLAAYFHSKQVFPNPKQTKEVNIRDTQCTTLYH